VNSVPTIRFATQAQNDVGRITTELAELQRQIASGKAVDDLKTLGDGSTRLISSAGLIRADENRIALAQELEGRLRLQATAMAQASGGVTELVRTMRAAALNKNGGNLTTGLEFAFSNLVQAMNQSLNGVPLFGGERVGDPPVKANRIEDLLSVATPDDLFNEAARKPRVDLGSGLALDVADRASEMSWQVFQGLRDLKTYIDAHGSALSATMTEDDTQAILNFASQIETAVNEIRGAESRNGFKLERIQSTRTQLANRVLSMQTELATQSETDLAAVVTRLRALETQYQATGQTFATLARLSLLEFLR
jgi:flagellin-like hook-associated protein FlgL